QAGVVITGERITAVGTLAELRAQHGQLPARHHAGLLLPGFVNAHTHLELSYQSAAALKGGDFPQWVAELMAGYPPARQLEAVVGQAFQKGLAQSLAAGGTTVGDSSRHFAVTRQEYQALAQAAVVPRVVSFAEIVGLGKMRHRAAELLDAACAPTPAPQSKIEN